MSKKIFVFAPIDEFEECHHPLEAAGGSLLFGDASWHTPMGNNEAEMCRLAGGAVAMMGTSIRSSPITRRIMESAGPELRIIAKFTVGVDDIDVDAATDMGIMVTHGPTESNWGGVAEGTMAMMLALLKKVRERDEAMKAGLWRSPELQGTYLGRRGSDGYPGITIGIVGLGRVGTRFAQLLAPWRVRLIAYDPHVEPMRFLLTGVKSVDYETLLRESDVISYHVVLTKETRNMCGAKEIGMRKRNAVVLNTARGKVIDEDALALAIKEGRIAAGAIDAFVEEPPAMDSPLRGLGDKLLMSPHAVAYNGKGELREGVEWAARSVHTALSGKIPDNVYNKDVLYRWKERFGDVSVLTG